MSKLSHSHVGQCNCTQIPVGELLLCDWLATMRFRPGLKELITSLKAASQGAEFR